MNRRAFLALGAGAAIAAPSPLLAHRLKAGLTKVDWNPRTNSLEIIHRLHAHDTQTALTMVLGVSKPNLDDLKVLARLALYVEENFSLAGDGSAITLKTVGAELEGDHLFIYQEAALTAPPRELTITNSILMDVFRSQNNTVNISRSGNVFKTLVFHRKHTEASAVFVQ